jgi:hypothetical protein
MGALRNRLVPPHQTAEVRKSFEETGLSSCYSHAGACLHRWPKGQDTASP